MTLILEDWTKMIQKFFEYKLSSEAYDSYYYIVLEENGRMAINGLLRGEFVGLKGIANHTKVIDVFLSYENDILLIMNKDEVDKLNDIEKFKYYDVEFLSKDNFKNLKRVLSFVQSRNLGSMMNHVIPSLNMGKFKDNDRYNKLRRLCATEPYEKLLEFLINKIYVFLINEEAENFDELVSIVNDAIDTMVFEDEDNDEIPNYNKTMIRNILEYKIIGVSSYYADESEYVVNSESFKIPEQSTIIIHNPSKAYINEVEFKELESKYKIKVIWNKKSALPIIRHLNKIKNFDVFKKIAPHV